MTGKVEGGGRRKFGGGGNYMVLRGNKGGISRGQQSINGRLKKIDCQLNANKECYGSFTEPYGE